MDICTAVPQTHTTSMARKMGLLFIMYMLQNIHTGFTWALFPMLMRKQGFGLSEIGFSVLVYSPWAMKFLYASAVDRWHLPGLGRRKTWFAPLMLSICLTLPLLSVLNPETQLMPILIGVFFLNWFSATADIAVDGYATDILHPQEMAWGNAVQMMGYGVGILLGSSVFLMMYEASGWRFTLLCMAGLYAILLQPVLLHREMDSVHHVTPTEKSDNPSALAFFKTATCRWALLFILICAWLVHGGNQMRFPMLVDKGLDASDVGQLMFCFGAPINIMGSLLGGYLITRKGEFRVFMLGGALAATVSLWSVLVQQMEGSATWMVAVMFALDNLMVGIMMVLVYNLIMGISAGPHAATRFAVLCAANHVAMFTITPLASVLCGWLGYTALFSTLSVTSLLTILPARYLIRRKIHQMT